MSFFQKTPLRQNPIQKRVDHIELERRFAALPEHADQEDAADQSYLFDIWWGGSGFSWPRLLKESLVVVLGEPGSGKTWEFEFQAAKLLAVGQYACFLRLEELIAQPLAAVLGRNFAEFDVWSRGADVGYFFLDSVDESKLNGAEDFYVALRHFIDGLPADFRERTHVMLSSRVSEWHSETDGRRVTEHFGVVGLKEKSASSEEDEGRISNDRKGGLVVVQLAPLNRDQVSILARARSCNNVEDFLFALDRAHAWEFARRPIDVRACLGLISPPKVFIK